MIYNSYTLLAKNIKADKTSDGLTRNKRDSMNKPIRKNVTHHDTLSPLMYICVFGKMIFFPFLIAVVYQPIWKRSIVVYESE